MTKYHYLCKKPHRQTLLPCDAVTWCASCAKNLYLQSSLLQVFHFHNKKKLVSNTCVLREFTSIGDSEALSK